MDDPERGYTAADLELHVRSEFSTWSWLLDALLDRTGFSPGVIDGQGDLCHQFWQTLTSRA